MIQAGTERRKMAAGGVAVGQEVESMSMTKTTRVEKRMLKLKRSLMVTKITSAIIMIKPETEAASIALFILM